MGLLSSILKLLGIGITGKREAGHPQRVNASMPSDSYPPYRPERDARYFASAKAKLDRFRVQASVADQMVLDTETTGNSNDAQIIEIGAILIRDNRPIAEYEQLIRPYDGLRLSSTLLSGITEDELLDQPDAEFIIPGFLEAIRSLNVIGHNVAFDINMLAMESRRYGCPPPDASLTDTLVLARRMFPNAPSLSLQELIRLLGIDQLEDHRALSDARQTWACWQRLNSMTAPVMLTREQQEESANRDLKEKRRKNTIFAKSLYLDGMDLEPVNKRPSDVEVRTFEQGIEVSGDENHQDSLKPYGYDAWIWAYVVEGRIPKGKYEGYPTYWVYLDGEEIGYISKYQMERHCGQVPGDGASMIAHIPDRAKDREVDRLQLRLHMPFEHEPVDLSSQVVRKEKPKTVKRPKLQNRQPAKSASADSGFLNPKPHKRTLGRGGEWVQIDSIDGISDVLSEFPDGSHVWVIVRRNCTVKLGGVLLGTCDLLSSIDDCDGDGLVAAAAIERTDDKTTVRIEMHTEVNDQHISRRIAEKREQGQDTGETVEAKTPTN